MLARLRFLLGYCTFWLAFFIVARVLFLAYEHAETAQLTAGTIAGTFLYGLRLDLATMTFVSAIPVLLVVVSAFVPLRPIAWLVNGYTFLALGFASFLVAGDLEVYRAWGARVDGGVLTYLKSPSQAYASSASSPLFLLTALLFALLGVFAAIYFRTLAGKVGRLPPTRPAASIPLFLCVLPLVIAARGGLQLSPLNLSSAYFSEEQFANHAAINATWNFLDSVYGNKHDRKNHYVYMPEERARKIVRELLPPLEPPRSVLRTTRPNVVLIIWEGLSAKLMARTEGREGVTPMLERHSHEGILFDRIYASGGRSDRGLVAIQSGFPAQPKTSIMRVTTKTAKLPILSRDFKAAGYSTGYFYGGELQFANMRSYVLHGGFEYIVEKEDFPRASWNSKWGAHDEVVLDALLEGCNKAVQPFFYVTFTLSSHEPYEVPGTPAFPGDGELEKFLSATNYTDRCVGKFLERAKTQPWWANTLVIIVADHGHRLPSIDPRPGHSSPLDFHVPMVWLGGALAVQDEAIHVVGSHADLPNTLLAQLGLPASEYHFGKDLLAPNAVPFAYYSFNDGLGFVTPAGISVFDNAAKALIQKVGDVREEDLLAGQAYQQLVVQEYLDR